MTEKDVTQTFEQLFSAQRELALADERVHKARVMLDFAEGEQRDARDALERVNERMVQMARRAAGVPEPMPAAERAEYAPIRRF